MRDFFHGWRRKAGGVLFVMALLTFGGFVRSFLVWDRLFIRVGPIMHLVTSFDGCVSWWSREIGQLEVYSTEIVPEWKTRSAAEGREYAATEPLQSWLIPYWFLAIPLTLLSAYLILWKPRKRATPSAACQQNGVCAP